MIPKKKIILPPISQKTNLESIEKEDINYNEFKELHYSNEYNIKKEETNNFNNLSTIPDNNQNFSNFE